MSRQALRYIARNTSLPSKIRTVAQLELAQMHCYTRPTQINNRCIMGGVSRSVFRDFRLGRVSDSILSICHSSLTTLAVSIPNERTGWQSTGSEEGQLVKFLYKYTLRKRRDIILSGVYGIAAESQSQLQDALLRQSAKEKDEYIYSETSVGLCSHFTRSNFRRNPSLCAYRFQSYNIEIASGQVCRHMHEGCTTAT